MPGSVTSLPRWVTLILVSGIPRILGAFFLPNAFGDAYVYIRDAGSISAKLSQGTFSISDLYGFWLPLYQFICAIVNVFIGQPFYVSKLVSALFGVGVCLFIYHLTLHLTRHSKAALWTFVLVALNPLHIFNSASAMTDVPSAFFVLGSLYFALKKRWIIAAVFAALAGLTRVDNWMLIALLLLFQFLEERRVSIIACAVLIFPPLFWFYISWNATGDWLACFVTRKEYMDALLAANPSLATFTLTSMARDFGSLVIPTGIAVLIACFVAAGLVFKRLNASAAGRKSGTVRAVAAASFYFFAYLSFIVLAYLTHTQPIIFPRYGLILFALGLPILPWTFFEITRRKPQWSRRVLVTVIAICVFEASVELAGSVGFINQTSAQRAVADYLHVRFQPAANAHIFCDEGTVRALSGLPEEIFLTSVDAPRDRAGFLGYLKENNVEYVVFINKTDSIPAKLFPESRSGGTDEPFKPEMHSSSRFLRIDIWVYRVKYPFQSPPT